MNLNALNIIMVGPSGVGKTTLLAAMYDKLKDEIGNLGCELFPSDEAEDEIYDAKEALKRFAEGKDFIPTEPGIAGNSQIREYLFELKVPLQGSAEKIKYNLKFSDIPGRLYIGGQGDTVRQLRSESHASFLAVDTPSLMERPDKDGIGEYFKAFNSPVQITDDFYDKTLSKFSENKQKHSIIITLVRAEKYLHTNQFDEMVSKVRIAYAKLIELAKKNKTPIFVCAVETVGCVEFSRYDSSEDDLHKPVFIRTGGRKYAPEHCAIPVRLVMRQCIDQKKDEVAENIGFWDELLKLLGIGNAHKQLDTLKKLFKGLSQKLDDNKFYKEL